MGYTAAMENKQDKEICAAINDFILAVSRGTLYTKPQGEFGIMRDTRIPTGSVGIGPVGHGVWFYKNKDFKSFGVSWEIKGDGRHQTLSVLYGESKIAGVHLDLRSLEKAGDKENYKSFSYHPDEDKVHSSLYALGDDEAGYTPSPELKNTILGRLSAATAVADKTLALRSPALLKRYQTLHCGRVLNKAQAIASDKDK
jgi:hypothetical protein